MSKHRTRRILTTAIAVLLAVTTLGFLALPAQAKTKKKTTKKTTTTSKKKSTTTTSTTANYKLTIPAALITGSDVTVTVTGNVVATDDGLYHLYAQQPYESGVQGTEVANAAAAQTQTFTFALNNNSANSMLFKKFVVVGTVGGTLTQLSNAEYITNPEAAAPKAAARYDGNGKKGMLLSAHLIDRVDYLTDLGVDQITYNLPIGNLMTDPSLGFESYTYNGKNYQFSKAILGQYDIIVPKMNKAGISVTLILLNNLTSDTNLIHPQSLDGTQANYYAFNTANSAGTDELEAIASYLGKRYSGDHGTVDNWVVGNEVNARSEWNYINAAVGETYAAKAYTDAVRIFYNGILSQNANARVYVGIDHEWSKSDGIPAELHYGGKSFLQSVQAAASAEGNFNYGVATHPYNVPLYNALTWAPAIQNSVTDDQNSVYVTMANIDVLTDFLCSKKNLQTDGQVRSVLCSEVGYTSLPSHGYASDDNVQSAALAFGFWQAMNNQYIDGFFNREVDDPSEIAQISDGQPDNLAMGVLSTPDWKTFTPKKSYNTYKYIDDPAQQAAILQDASAAIGQDINSLIHAR
ncbi:MAG: DUF5722 domain-containing protein [Lachnospiraceae bacterium]|nr:DUF5722 domain-containing protein [Lachnospiraceae bacterium]MCI1423127.1 DUF5722 domain-containing protein [Lachnospiraceae bacterium]MCI1451973.1 DUF5722 domain-containing protein [Lachnospiraceae bacterium]